MAIVLKIIATATGAITITIIFTVLCLACSAEYCTQYVARHLIGYMMRVVHDHVLCTHYMSHVIHKACDMNH